MSLRDTEQAWYYYLYSAILAGGLFTFAHRFVVKPEQLWYKGRALAESIKTSTWRFCMRASPFESDNHVQAAALYRNHLKSVLEANKFAGAKMPPTGADGEQITREMLDLRAKGCNERLASYIADRIKEQRAWYARKAGANRSWATRWAAARV